MKYFNSVLLVFVAGFIFCSCTDIYDNIRDFSPEEIIYPATFDTIGWNLGYERIEFILSKKGKIPSDQMNLGKAEKTVVEYDNKRIVIDSVCSWINISGLTEPRLYHFKIYTESKDGDKSIPQEAQITPFTKTDLNLLTLVPPNIIESTSAAVVEWAAPIESDLYEFFSYTAEYVDKDGQAFSFEGGNLPSFILENIQAGVDILVKINARILPYIGQTPLLDTIPAWETSLNVRVSEAAKPAIFLKSPSPASTINIYHDDFPLEFSWTKIPNASGYILKFSKSLDFDPQSTKTIEVGDVGSYYMTKDEMINHIFSDFDPIISPERYYWQVVPSEQTEPVRAQARAINYKHVEGDLVTKIVETTDPMNIYTGNTVFIWEPGVYRDGDSYLVFGSVEMTFTGRYIAWYALYNSDLPTAKIYIDGEFYQEVNCFSYNRRVDKIFEKKWAFDGKHTIKVSPNWNCVVHDYFVYIQEEEK